MTRRRYGWSLDEHLLISALAFPLTVKVILSDHKLYDLAENGLIGPGAIDLILNSENWGSSARDENHNAWTKDLWIRAPRFLIMSLQKRLES